MRLREGRRPCAGRTSAMSPAVQGALFTRCLLATFAHFSKYAEFAQKHHNDHFFLPTKSRSANNKRTYNSEIRLHGPVQPALSRCLWDVTTWQT